MRTYTTEIQVRGYELDGYGHMNNAVYLNYAEHARWKMIEDCGGGVDYFKNHGVAPVVVRSEIDYREPCYIGEYLILETTLLEKRTRTAKFRHVVRKRDSGRVAAEIVMTLVVVGPEGKAVTLPADFEKAFS